MDSTSIEAPEEYRGIVAHENTEPAQTLPGTNTGFFLDKGHGMRHTVFTQLLTTMISAKETEGRFSAIVLQGPASPDPVPAHYHEHEDEWTFILEGKVHWWVGSEHRICYPGDSVYQPRMVPHGFRFEGTYNKMLAVNVAGGFEAFFDIIGKRTELFSAPLEVSIPQQNQWREAAEKFGWHAVPDYDYGI